MSHSREVRCLEDGRLLGWAVKPEFPADGLMAQLEFKDQPGLASYAWGAIASGNPEQGEFSLHVNVPRDRVFELDYVKGFYPFKEQC